MARQIEVLTETVDVRNALENFGGWTDQIDPENCALVCQLGGGVLKFAETIFPDTPPSNLWAQYELRDRVGKGPHFDLYSDYIENDHNWFGVYYLTGKAVLKATVLPADLAKYYEDNFPDIDESAYMARRSLGGLALDSHNSVVLQDNIEPGSGLIMPLRTNSQHVVHELTPPKSGDIGSYVKLIDPSESPNIRQALRDVGMMPFDEFITSKLDGSYDPVIISTPGVVEPLMPQDVELPGRRLDSGFKPFGPSQPGRDARDFGYETRSGGGID